MKITIESTTKIVELKTDSRPGWDSGNMPARVWEGVTESGIPVHVFITRLAPTIPVDDPRQEEFQRELSEQKAPTAAVASYPLRMIL